MLFRYLSPISCYVVCRWGNQPEISIIVGWILEGLLLANTHFRHRGREWHLLSSNWIKCRRCEFDETASRRAWHLQFRHVVQNDSLRDSTSCENDPFLWVRANVHRGEFMNGKDRYISLWLHDCGETRTLSISDIRTYQCITWLRLCGENTLIFFTLFYFQWLIN